MAVADSRRAVRVSLVARRILVSARAALEASPLGTWLRSITPAGWAMAVGGLTALGATLLWGWVEAAVVAIVSAVCLVVALASVLGRSSYQISVVLPHERTVVGKAALGEVRVRNTRTRRVGTSVIELPVRAPQAYSDTQFVVPSLGAGEEWHEVFAVPARRRGVVDLGPLRSVRTDALGLVRRIRSWSDSRTLHVNPLTVRVPYGLVGAHLDVEGVSTAKLSSSDVSFHALRDYVPGDDRRFVHWPTSVRVGHLVVRQFEETRRSQHLVVLHTGREVWNDETFEVGVSVAASFVRALMEQGLAVAAITSEGWISTSNPEHMLDEFTEVRLAPDAAPLAARLHEALAAYPMTSVCTIVTGDEDDATLARYLAHTGPDAVSVAIRVRPDSPAARHDTGDGVILDCPSLAELPRLANRLGWA